MLVKIVERTMNLGSDNLLAKLIVKGMVEDSLP